MFGPSGNLVDSWGEFPAGPAEFNAPSDVAVDGSGRVAVTQENESSVKVYSSSGDLLFTMGQLGSPRAVAVDRDGYFYVGEGWRTNQIRRLDPNGVSVGRIGQGVFSDQGMFGYYSPSGVAVTGAGEVVASDTGNDRILVFDAAGTLLRQWGSSGTGPGEFDEPVGVAVDPAGNVYVADTFNQRVQVFDSAGRFLLQWGSFGLDPGEFRHPWGLAVDAPGYVYVTDRFNHRVQKFHVTLPTSAGMLTAVQPTTWGRLKTMFAR